MFGICIAFSYELVTEDFAAVRLLDARKVGVVRKLIVFLILVIVLVSINWFTSRADDTKGLSEEELSRLFRQHRQSLPQEHYVPSYRSPEIYGKAETDPGFRTSGAGSATVDSHKLDIRPETIRDETNRESDAAGKLPAFDALRPFGLNLFSGQATMDTPIDIASAAEYILGPGDNIVIYLWGRVDHEFNLTVDREGKVFLPKAGDVTAWGLTLARFTEEVQKRLANVYTDFEITVSLGKIRSMRIYITGEVVRPGAYAVPSLTSVLNAIFVAGGPNVRGSMRDIRVMRSGQPVAVIDLYDFLLKGDNSNDVRLETGDAVFVPVAGPRVAVRGEVKRAAIYEVKGGETVSDLLTLAGGHTPAAYLDRIMLERIGEENDWEVLDLNLNGDGPNGSQSLALQDGDRVTVFSIFEARKNMVAIFGKVQHPGYFERNDTTRLSDLLERGQLQPYDVYYSRADLFRRHSDYRIQIIPVDLRNVLAGKTDADVLLTDRDSVHVYGIDEIEREKYVHIEGEVDRSGRYPLYDHMTVADLIFLAGSFTRSADRQQAELARLNEDGNVSLLYLNLDDSTDRVTRLACDDHLYIRRIPDWRLDRSVMISGEVKFPGQYWLTNRNETLYDLLTRCGGFTAKAFARGIVLERRSIQRNLQQLKVPDLLERSQPLYQDSLGNITGNELFDYRPQSVNRIILDMDEILATQGAREDVVLEPGDHIIVPSVPSGISVIGAVGSNGTIKFRKNRNVDYYVKRAGNFTRRADKDETRLIRAWGEVISGGVLKKKVEIGDVIVVPTKIEKERNWLKTLSTALTATTGALTTVFLISKI